MKRLMVYVFVMGIIGMCMQQQGASHMNKEETITQEAILPERIYIPIIVKGLQATFWEPVRQGAERAAQDYGVDITFEGTFGEGEVNEQLMLLVRALEREPQAIVLSAVDSRAATPYLESAQAAGIPVIGFDSGVDSPIVRTTVATDNYGAGALAGSKMAELLNGTGEVAVIVQDSTSKVATDRRDGFIDAITQRYPAMKIVAVEYGGGDVALSAQRAENIIRENPNIAGIFGGNEGSANGVIQAVNNLNKAGDILVIGFDSGKMLTDAIREGAVAGAVTQNPIGIGYQGVEAAIRAYRGENLPPFIDTGFAWYDQSNIDQPGIRELLYE